MKTLLPDFPILALARALEVSRSGFHAHLHKAARPRRQADAALIALLTQAFAESHQTYGSPRLHHELQAQGQRCGRNRVARLMREASLRPKQKRRFHPQTTDARHSHPIAPNWLARVPTPDRPGMIWQSDITFIPTGEGWLFLAFTLDSCSRRVAGYHCAEEITAELTTTAFQRACVRHPPSPGLLHHSDRGTQYAASLFQAELKAFGVTASMSRSGNPYDNALAESFVATLKTECFGPYVPGTRLEARLLIFHYLEAFYNPKRRHSSLGYRSPAEFEALFTHSSSPSQPVTKTQNPNRKKQTKIGFVEVSH
jgi:transposase InsO family protein